MIRRRRAFDVVREGELDALASQARDRALLEAVAAGRAFDVLRFYRLRPCAMVGRHQALARELRLDYCRRAQIAIARRLTGGGALYRDPGELAFSLVTRVPVPLRALPLDRLLAMLAGAVARALRSIGLRARVGWPNDVEVKGGKIASVHVVRSDRAMLVQGGVLVQLDVERVLEVLRVPTEKLTARGLATARERYAPFASVRARLPAPHELERALAAAFGRMLHARPRWREAPREDAQEDETALQAERDFARLLSWEDTAPDAIEALVRARAGATVRARARFSAADTIEEIELATDAWIEPSGFLEALCARLRGTSAASAEVAVRDAARACGAQLCGATLEDVADVLAQLAAKRALVLRHGLSCSEVNALMLACYERGADLSEQLGRAAAILVPYCAKPAWCKFRHRDGCSECGLCEVGDAYRIARERAMQVTTVTSYEHLLETLERLKRQRTAAYIGMCCEPFFVKRHRAFGQAGVAGVLMGIRGANCYELKEERAAYAGEFRAEARLDRALLERLQPLLPPRAGASARGEP
jgi:lipoate-protein ligase A